MKQPNAPIPGIFKALVQWLRHRYGVNLIGGRFDFERGLCVGGRHLTPELFDRLAALADGDKPASKNPRNKHAVKARDAPMDQGDDVLSE